MDKAWKSSLPSCKLKEMTLREFVGYANGLHSPAFYSKEYYYFSAQPLRNDAIESITASEPFSCLNNISGANSASTRKSYRLSGERVRITEKDSIHMLHFDFSATLLIVLQGYKQVEIVSETDLERTKPFMNRRDPRYRRSSVSLEQVALSTPVLTSVLGPGDAIMFNARAAHQTKSLSRVISLSFRLKEVSK